LIEDINVEEIDYLALALTWKKLKMEEIAVLYD